MYQSCYCETVPLGILASPFWMCWPLTPDWS